MAAGTVPLTDRARLLLGLALLTAALANPAPAAAAPGPPLLEPAAALERSVGCKGDLAGARATPVLLVHGALVDAGIWTPTYARTLPRAGVPTCTVSMPGGLLGDVQRDVEYVVHAIRMVAARAGRPIAVIGHSQGAFLSTLALRLWPDLGLKVDDFVGLGGMYANGTEVAAMICSVPCSANARQLSPGSRLLRAYGARSLYRGVDGPSYTTINTDIDELVTPQPRAGTLEGAQPISLQDLCPGRPVTHGSIIGDAVTYALVRDALEHRGPADPARLGTPACGELLMPGADGAGLAARTAAIALPFTGLVTQPVPAEPALRCALDAECPKSRLRPVVRSATTPRNDGRRPWVFTTRGAIEQPVGALEPCGGSVTVGVIRGDRTLSRRQVPVGRDCRFASSVRLGRTREAGRRVRGRLRVSVRFSGTPELMAAGAPTRRVVAR